MTEENNAPVAESSESGSSLGNALPPSIESSSESSEPAHSSESHSSDSGHDAKPEGYAPVDIKTASPEEIEKRINYIYGQLKPTQRENREMKQLLEQQSRIIQELSEGQRAVISHITEQNYVDTEEQLNQQMADAWQRQDAKAYREAQNKLMDLQVERKVAKATQPKQQSQQQAQQQWQPQNAAEISGRAADAGELTPEQHRVTSLWQDEKDEVGNLLRPWAFGNHPNHQAALFEARSVFANPRYEHWSHEQKLAEVDRRMGVAKRGSGQSVMGGNLTKPVKNQKIELTPKQREIALKTKYAGKGKSEADHLAKFRAQVEKYDARRRAR